MTSLPSRIPLFPLPNVVFFPQTHLPLHIFEPRYRQMVADALDTHRFIGIVLLKEGWERDYDGHPPVHSVGCVGKIAHCQPKEDGRYDIVLYGLSRFEIIDEIRERTYRQGNVRYISPPRSTPLPSTIREEVLRVISTFMQRPDIGKEAYTIVENIREDDKLLNTLCSTLPLTLLEQQFLLESEEMLQQSRRLIDLIRLRSEANPQRSPTEGLDGLR